MAKRMRDDPIDTLIAETVAAVGLRKIDSQAAVNHAMPLVLKNRRLLHMLAFGGLCKVFRDHAMRQPASAFTSEFTDPFNLKGGANVNAR